MRFGLEFDKYVNVAVRSEVVPQHRTKQGEPRDAVGLAECGQAILLNGNVSCSWSPALQSELRIPTPITHRLVRGRDWSPALPARSRDARTVTARRVCPCCIRGEEYRQLGLTARFPAQAFQPSSVAVRIHQREREGEAARAGGPCTHRRLSVPVVPPCPRQRYVGGLETRLDALPPAPHRAPVPIPPATLAGSVVRDRRRHEPARPCASPRDALLARTRLLRSRSRISNQASQPAISAWQRSCHRSQSRYGINPR